MTSTAAAKPRTSPSAAPRWKGVALPAEHGGWGFLIEPLLLGLLLAFTLPGLLLSVAAFAAFLMRQPLRVILVDWRRGRLYARTRLAARFALAYGAVAFMGLVGAWALAGPVILMPLLLAAPFALLQIGFDALGRSRHWLPELAGPVSLASVGAALLLAGGWALPLALAAWGILAARAIPAVLYVRARLRLEKGDPVDVRLPLLAHGFALLAGLLLVAGELAPLLAVLALLILLVRSSYGLSPLRRPAPAKVIGSLEIFYGLLTVGLVAAGYAML